MNNQSKIELTKSFIKNKIMSGEITGISDFEIEAIGFQNVYDENMTAYFIDEETYKKIPANLQKELTILLKS